MNDASMKYINRRDDATKATHGWQLRIQAVGLSRFFSDGKHGGREHALRLATQIRDNKLREAGIPLSARTVVTHSPRNTTGIIGVTVQRRGARRYYVVSYQNEIGRCARRSFAIPPDEAGARQALKDAVAFRRKQEQLIYGATVAANWTRAIGVVCN
jgi:hypothetical protein